MSRLLPPVSSMHKPFVLPELTPLDVTSFPLKAGWVASEFDGASDDDEPTSWTDVSGNGFDASPLGGSGNQPVVRKNALNTTMTALESNDQRGFVTGALSITSYHNWTVFAVVKFTAAGTTQNGCFTFNDGLSGGAGFDTGFGRDSTGKFRFNNYDASVALSSDSIDDNWHYIVLRSNGGGDANVELWVDGVLFPWTGSFPDQGAVVGAIRLMEQRNSAGHLMIGQAAEFDVYPGPITTYERQNCLQAYARRVYGL